MTGASHEAAATAPGRLTHDAYYGEYAHWETLTPEQRSDWERAERAAQAVRAGCPIEAVLPDGHHPCTLERDHKTGHNFADEPRPW